MSTSEKIWQIQGCLDLRDASVSRPDTGNHATDATMSTLEKGKHVMMASMSCEGKHVMWRQACLHLMQCLDRVYKGFISRIQRMHLACTKDASPIHRRSRAYLISWSRMQRIGDQEHIKIRYANALSYGCNGNRMARKRAACCWYAMMSHEPWVISHKVWVMTGYEWWDSMSHETWQERCGRWCIMRDAVDAVDGASDAVDGASWDVPYSYVASCCNPRPV